MIQHQADNSVGNYLYNSVYYNDIFWPLHFHRGFEFCRILKGTVNITVGSRVFDANAGDSVMILPDQIHGYRGAPGSRTWIAVFSADYVPDFAALTAQRQGKSAVFTLQRSVAALTDDVLEPATGKDGSVPILMRQACLQAICADYYSSTEFEHRLADTSLRIGKVLDYLSEHYAEPLELRDIAKHFGYEYHYLSRILGKQYNIRFCELISRYRVEAACEYLRKYDMPVTEAALKSGFQSVRAFNAVFRKTVGCTPTEYRNGNNRLLAKR